MTVTGGDAAAGDDIVAYFPVGALILNVAVITNTTYGQFFLEMNLCLSEIYTGHLE